MDVLKLRPHHINCIFFYEGKGYSEQFVKNMNALVKHLGEHPEQKIMLQCAPDHLCEHCPYLQDKVCLSQEKVGCLDQATQKAYDLQPQQVYLFQDIKEKIYHTYDAETFHTICKACEWYKKGVCSAEKIPSQQKVWK